MQMPFILNILIRFVSVIVMIYSIFEVYTGLDNGFIVRRGIQYSLEEEPRSFFINVAKWAGIACICVYVAVKGIQLKSNESSSDH